MGLQLSTGAGLSKTTFSPDERSMLHQVFRDVFQPNPSDVRVVFSYLPAPDAAVGVQWGWEQASAPVGSFPFQ